MNKFGIVLGAAAVVTLAGCKDPDYKYANTPSQGEVKNAAATETIVEKAPAPTPAPVPVAEPAPAPVPAPAVELAFTEYVVQEGDYLSKISKRFNVTLASIHKLNPSLKKDVIRVGQKIKLPGKIDIGAQKTPVKAVKATKRSGQAAAYTGATKEYVVKNGDTLGSIAYGNGINIRQLKQLNGLTSDALKIGQKLKVPGEKVVKPSPAPVKKPDAGAPTKPEVSVPPTDKPPVDTVAPVAPNKPVEQPVANAVVPAQEPVSTPAPTATYVVQEGDDMTGVSIRWGVSAAEIRELNNLGEKDQLVPGQVIKLPAEAQQ